ncbi:MAG: FAD-binding protein [Clostridia bacterium]|nr:FAD-binding protein [Clostridia bacterium]
MNKHYNIVIIGAGPSGCIFASELYKSNKNYSIALIDGQTEENKKPCGGLLAPDAQKELTKLNLTLPKYILTDPQIFEVETIDLKSRIKKYYQRHYLNMDRYKFDKWLLSLIPEGVDVINDRCIYIRKSESIYNLKLKNGVEISCDYIVGADGGSSIVRRTLFPALTYRYTSIQEWFKCDKGLFPYYSCIFDPNTSDSCSWTIFKDDYIIYGGAFKTLDCKTRYEEQKKMVEEYIGYKFGKPERTEACMLSSPRKWKDFLCGRENAYLIGEAAGFISSSSFEGISSALASGKMLSLAFINSKKSKNILKLYKKYSFKLRIKLYLKTLKRKILCSPFLRFIIMKSGIKSIKKY